ncbi:type II toxin-antitoxin system RelE/ParE family toxin [Polymorphobacter sp. PAMC 29334]|uniref:type II toxin-antitoxin system RelE/ParE family toxin n=1 Tax=Polymorphobacter sp. PAMC 29334 TaxID=2862331 RepID=UPI001C677EBB|nr:type II toxin-antitoxin system RelE/ParE family toxin [Polymorphobacter sp. PAMC 29334]QYE34821.1 type II toxin-antitoxin system RelE/ParE family toxin [Polymorphobacter sp. PAMC 29334]
MKRRISVAAQHDIAAILDWSADHFGAAARARYERLIERALTMITIHRDPSGGRIISGVFARRLYHLRNCRADSVGETVGNPRHVIVYQIVEPDLVVVARILHDAMDLPAHFTDG